MEWREIGKVSDISAAKFLKSDYQLPSSKQLPDVDPLILAKLNSNTGSYIFFCRTIVRKSMVRITRFGSKECSAYLDESSKATTRYYTKATVLGCQILALKAVIKIKNSVLLSAVHSYDFFMQTRN